MLKDGVMMKYICLDGERWSEDGETFHVGLHVPILRDKRHRKAWSESQGIGSRRFGGKGPQTLVARFFPFYDEVICYANPEM